MLMDLKTGEWDQSYRQGDNVLFYPHEEIIRFISKYVVKRRGIDFFDPIIEPGKFLDLGCGAGRHVIYAWESTLDAYGIDLSEIAVQKAREWASKRSMGNVGPRFLVGDVTCLPWSTSFFNVVVSHGVLDSMPFETAQKAVKETFRVTTSKALFYCDLVSSPDQKSECEEIVETEHEKGTILIRYPLRANPRNDLSVLTYSYWFMVNPVFITNQSTLFPLSGNSAKRFFIDLLVIKDDVSPRAFWSRFTEALDGRT